MIALVNDSVGFGETVPLDVGFPYKRHKKYGSKNQSMNVFRISTKCIESR